MATPISKSGLPVVPGLKKDPNAKSAFAKLFVYEQKADSIFDQYCNLFKLKDTSKLEGFELFKARVGNCYAMAINPFATLEGWRLMFNELA